MLMRRSENHIHRCCSAVSPFLSIHRLGHPDNCLFLLSTRYTLWIKVSPLRRRTKNRSPAVQDVFRVLHESPSMMVAYHKHLGSEGVSISNWSGNQRLIQYQLRVKLPAIARNFVSTLLYLLRPVIAFHPIHPLQQ